MSIILDFSIAYFSYDERIGSSQIIWMFKKKYF